MTRLRLAGKVRKRRLRAMGPDLGPLYHALHEEVTWLHAKWLHYRQLYGHSPARVELLNGVAGFLFRVVQAVLWEDLLRHLARVTDSPERVGTASLTLRRLPMAVPDAALAREVRVLVQAAVSESGFARRWRTRRAARRELALASAVGAELLPDDSRHKVETALAACRAVLDRIAGRYFPARIAFDRSIAHRDGDALVYHLRLARDAERRRRERLVEGRPWPEDIEPPPEA